MKFKVGGKNLDITVSEARIWPQPGKTESFTSEQISGVIAMAWCDKTSFELIQAEYGLTEPQVKQLMRKHLKSGSYQCWRRRVTGRQKKHAQKRATHG